MAKDVAALKVVSQNLMHENLTVTDGVYGVLSERDVRDRIIRLGREVAPRAARAEDLKLLIRQLSAMLEAGQEG
jgi:hypothetical protein